MTESKESRLVLESITDIAEAGELIKDFIIDSKPNTENKKVTIEFKIIEQE